ncbi:MAG: autorepressor SdpR family transcription factor [bacterium]
MNAVFKALADPTRREILRLLGDRAMTAGEIADRFPLAKSTLSGHFNVLKAADLISAEKRAQTVVYSLNLSVFEEATAAFMELFRIGARRTRAADRLKEKVS